MSLYLVNDAFVPSQLTQGQLEGLFQVLSGSDWRREGPDAPGEIEAAMIAGLRKIHWAARRAIGGNLGTRSLDADMLKRLRARVARQAEQARTLQRHLAGAHADQVLQQEAEQLVAYFDELDDEIARQLGRGKALGLHRCG